MSAEPPDLAPLEAWFRRSGMPQLCRDDDSREETLRRIRPALVVLAVAGVAVALAVDWPWWRRGLVVLVVVGVLVALAYGLASLGVVSLLVHQGRPMLDGLSATASVAIRALPPLLAVLLFLSLAQETWRAFGRLEGWRFGFVLVGFGILAALILVVGLRRERVALYAPPPAADLERLALATPAAALVSAGAPPLAPPLERLERVNVAVALVLSLAVRVLAVGVAVAAAFMAFGVLIVDRALTAEWIEAPPHILLELSISGREVVVSEALVRVATVLGGFAAMYFAAVALGDARNREQFLDDELERVGRVMAARSYYRGAVAARVTSRPGPAADG